MWDRFTCSIMYSQLSISFCLQTAVEHECLFLCAELYYAETTTEERGSWSLEVPQVYNHHLVLPSSFLINILEHSAILTFIFLTLTLEILCLLMLLLLPFILTFRILHAKTNPFWVSERHCSNCCSTCLQSDETLVALKILYGHFPDVVA